MMMSEIAGTAFQPFWSAEVDYRLERARRDYDQRGVVKHRIRRLKVRRRRGLPQPGRSRRPLAVA